MMTCLSMMSLLFVVLMGFLCPSDARRHIFHVGGKDGWVTKPSESYNQWAQKHHFFVHDELVFKYEEGQDSVLVVNEKDYYKCNKDNPIRVLKLKKNGESTFKFHRPGPFFFISGHYHNCENGEKLIVLVQPDPDHRPSPSPETPSVSVPPSQSPSPAADTPFPADAPPVGSPSDAPSQSPAADTPLPAADAPLVGPPSGSPSQSPIADTPFPADAPLVGPPSDSPSQSPAADTPLPADAPLVGPPSDAPSQSPAADTPFPADAPLVGPPSDSPSQSPAPYTPFPVDAPLNEPISNSPSQSPEAQTVLAHTPADHDHPRAQSPLPSTHDNIALPPHVFSPHHAPAPAPSSASDFGGSLVVIVGLMSVAATMISIV